VAQLVRALPCEGGVGGSSPSTPILIESIMGNQDHWIKALEELNKKLEDPVYLAKIIAEMDLEHVAEENRLICAVVSDDPRYRQASWGDMIAYGLDHDYYTKLEHRAMDLFYQFHGNGD
jgi:hypothetical protein